MLVTSFDLKTNLYGGFYDRFTFWEKQIDDFSFEKIERPKLRDNIRKDYLKKHTPKIIEITSKNDFKKLTILNVDNNYLIQINTDLSVETYIKIKEKISKIRELQKIRIRTEFNLYLSN